MNRIAIWACLIPIVAFAAPKHPKAVTADERSRIIATVDHGEQVKDEPTYFDARNWASKGVILVWRIDGTARCVSAYVVARAKTSTGFRLVGGILDGTPSAWAEEHAPCSWENCPDLRVRAVPGATAFEVYGKMGRLCHQKFYQRFACSAHECHIVVDTDNEGRRHMFQGPPPPDPVR